MGRADASIKRLGRGAAALALFVLALTLADACAHAQSDPVKGSAALAVQGGFARLVVTLDDDVDTEVATSGNVMIMRFKRPVAINFGELDAATREYVGAVRRDPDNLAVRFALQRKVTLNTMSVGERIFVDLLPDDWKGPPPGLPQQVVRDLAERARTAERTLRQQRLAASPPRERPTVRVRASQQPTFTRFVFDIPEGVTGSSAIAARKLTVSFDKPLNFDLADAKLAVPASVGALSQRVDDNGSAVEIALVGDADFRAFHDDKAYVVDLVRLASDPASKVERLAALTAPLAAKVVEEVAMPAADVAPATSQAVAAALQTTAPAPATKPAAIAQPAENVSPPEAKAPAAAVDAKRNSDGLRLEFALPRGTPAALFRRADAMWLVLDWDGPIDLAAIRRVGGALIGDVTARKLDSGQAIRIRLNRPQLAALVPTEGDDRATGWSMLLSDAAQSVPQPLDALRKMAEPGRASVVVPLRGAGRLHRVVDPDVGDTLQVVTATAPARGMMRRQDFVEFSLLETVHGVAIQANADDLTIDTNPERVTLSRPGGLTLSAALGGTSRATSVVKPIFDAGEWRNNLGGPFSVRLDALNAALSAAPDGARAAARSDLARFYLARGFYPEAKAILDSLVQPDSGEAVEAVALVLHALASTLMGRPELALKDLAAPALGSNYDAQLWQAMALAQQEKWASAREKFKNAGLAINALPVELQRIALLQAIRASIEVNDFSDAASHMSELELVGIPEDSKPSAMVLRGRIALAMARDDDAVSDFHSAAQSEDRKAASDARLREIALLQKRDGIANADAVRDIETISMTWRGDATEVMALQMLVKLYAKTERYADALAAVRTATLRQPNSDASRQMQDVAAELFSDLYLTPKGDGIPPIEALATFYENRDLTPIGRRGDELIRKLAERLVAVDLLDQASELLQYQVDHRLEGAARAQVAGRLATVYLMNRKPDRAIAALQATRIADLGGELRQQRLLLEARAQSDIGRRDLALDIISNIGGQEAVRLRSDIHWGARRWREAAEQIELYFGDRWRDFTPLTPSEKSDVVRAMVGYLLAEDSLGLGRFRDKFAPFMTDASDRVVFDIAAKPAAASNANFAQVAKMAAGVDTLDGFLRDMKSRFQGVARARQAPEAEITGSLPKIGSRRADAVR